MEFILLVGLYALQKFTEPQCDIAFRLKADGISILWNHFGRDNTCLYRLLPKLRYVQIHISFHARKAAQVRRHRTAIYTLAKRYPGVMFLVGALEDEYGETEAKRAAQVLKRRKPPNVHLYRNSISCPRCRTRGYEYFETHTDKPSRGFDIASNDGWGIAWRGHRDAANERTLSEIKAAARASKGLRYYVLWIGEGQGIARPADRKIPARKRIIQITRGQVREINQILHGLTIGRNRSP